MEYRDTDKKDAHKQKAWRDAVHNFKEAQEALKTAREAYYGCGNILARRCGCPHRQYRLEDFLWHCSQSSGCDEPQASYLPASAHSHRDHEYTHCLKRKTDGHGINRSSVALLPIVRWPCAVNLASLLCLSYCPLAIAAGPRRR